jgi:hypothetical protein
MSPTVSIPIRGAAGMLTVVSVGVRAVDAARQIAKMARCPTNPMVPSGLEQAVRA